ncbi:hypothetical protein [Streptomyces sp. NPDC056527]|uniref:hypothetical protein n=1 Tax=Streptomyces sp. NPDC056527 TaxID=3345853 RepID=UPI0036743184
MAIPTPTEYRAAHGDPTNWCGAQIDECLDDCLAQLPTPTPTVGQLIAGTTGSGKNSPIPLTGTAA